MSTEKLTVPTLRNAIKKKCLDCASTQEEVKHCPIKTCPLYPFRVIRNGTETNQN